MAKVTQLVGTFLGCAYWSFKFSKMLPPQAVAKYFLPFFPLRNLLENLVKVLVAQSCLTLCNPMDCSLLGSSVHGIVQARILEGVVIPFSRGSSQPRD